MSGTGEASSAEAVAVSGCGLVRSATGSDVLCLRVEETEDGGFLLLRGDEVVGTILIDAVDGPALLLHNGLD